MIIMIREGIFELNDYCLLYSIIQIINVKIFVSLKQKIIKKNQKKYLWEKNNILQYFSKNLTIDFQVANV